MGPETRYLDMWQGGATMIPSLRMTSRLSTSWRADELAGYQIIMRYLIYDTEPPRPEVT
jgi:hypothetical protein